MVNALSSASPFIPTPSTDAPAIKAVPGFDKAGAPLADADVWGLSIGKTRTVNTAAGLGPSHIDGAERSALLSLAKEKPQEFLQRLLADSMNGTPVEYNLTRKIDIGVVRVSFSAVNGTINTTASLDVFNNQADKYLKPYLAQKARDKGARSRITLSMGGQLNKNGGLDDVKLEAKLSGAPKFSVAKLVGIATIEKDLKKALAAEGSQKDKSAKVLSLVSEAIEKLSDVPLPFLVKLIGSSDVMKAELTSKEIDGHAKVQLGKGKFAVGLRDFIGSKKDEPDVRASLTGRAALPEDKDALALDELRVFANDKLAVEWTDTGAPKLSRIDAKGGRTPVNDHFGEVLTYLPLALALAGGHIID